MTWWNIACQAITAKDANVQTTNAKPVFPALQCKCNNCFVGKNIFELWTGPIKT